MTDPTPQTTPTRDEAVPDDIVQRVADAIDRATVGYSMRLTRLVDEESTYTLTYEDGEKHEFDDIDDGYAHIKQRKLRAQAVYVIEALATATAPAPASGGVDAVKAALDADNGIAAFERWAQPAGYLMHLYEGPDSERRYLYASTDNAWLAWCASRASLSPAATPVSEAGPVAWRWRLEGRTDWFVAANRGDIPKQFGVTGRDKVSHVVEPEIEPLYALAKPASSPAGGDVVETLVPLKWRHVDVEQFEAHSIIGTYEVCGQHWSFVPTLKKAGAEMGSLDEARKAAQSHRDMYGPQPRRAALSQSTSAGRVGE